jgi:hypothetical protein
MGAYRLTVTTIPIIWQCLSQHSGGRGRRISEFKASLVYIEKPCLEKTKKKKEKKKKETVRWQTGRRITTGL